MNLTAVTEFYSETDPSRLEKMLLSPRKVFTGVKVLREGRSGLYNETSKLQKEHWQRSFVEGLNLP